MSFSKEALQEIRDLCFIPSLSKKLPETYTPIAALPNDFSIHNLEKYELERSRFRGVMATTSIADFIRYSIEFSGEGVRCFINAEDMLANTIFNIGTLYEPGHADNQAVLKLNKTAPFKAILDIDGDKKRQKDTAEWLEDWRDNLVAFDADGNLLNMKKAIAAVRKITIESSRSAEHEDSDFKASRSAMESIEAKSKETLPAGFKFACIPYEGLKESQIHLRLSILTGGEVPVFVLRIVQLEAFTEQLASEFKDLLIKGFEGKNVETFIGKFQA